MTLYIGDDEIKAMVQSYHDGATIRQLAEIHNLSTTKVHGLLVQAGYRPRPKGRPADLKKTRAAYEMHKEGLSYGKISARMNNLSRGAVSKFVRRGREMAGDL